MQDGQSTATPEPERQFALEQIRRDLAQFELGPELHENVQQHYRHLETLTASLKTIGVDNAVIDIHVIEIFTKYKAAMLENIERIELERHPPSMIGQQQVKKD